MSRGHSQAFRQKYVPLHVGLEELSIADADEFGAEFGMGLEGADSVSRYYHQQNEGTRRRRNPNSKRIPELSSADYINMTSRFVVHPDTPPSIVGSPDTRIPRAAVLRLITAKQECPICLETANVPRMLDCGHVMCLVCFHRFLHHALEHLCPLCGKHVSKLVTPVSFLENDERFLPKPGSEVVLRLMMKKGPGIALPIAEQEKVVDSLPPVELALFSRIVTGTPEYVRTEGKKERSLLETLRQDEMSRYGGAEGYDKALADVRSAISTGVPKLQGLEWPKFEISRAPSSEFYYYETGFESYTTFVLSQLDITVLKAAYGDFSEFPASLVVKVDNVSYSTIDEDARKRYKYLNHLPTYSEIAFLECDWRGVIPNKTLKTFSKKLSERRRKKRNKDIIDEKRRLEAEEESDVLLKSEMLGTITPFEPVSIDVSKLPTLGDRPVMAPRTPKWDSMRADREEFEELMRNAHVAKRGRKRIVLFES